ncbi:MAG: hypothetical protein Q7S34_02885 [bacterium]|nr:hypothetical protein [bacterium]
MGKTIKIDCDCDCGASTTDPKAASWFVLFQQDNERSRNDEPKLERELYFKSLQCVGRWIKKANRVISSLQKTARGLHPRGALHNKEVPGLYV